MGMKKRIRKLIGLQESFVDLESGHNFHQDKTPTVPENTPIPAEQPVEKEERDHYGQRIESYHPKIQEVFSMNDPSPTSSTRAVGVDIGTGFISCAEKEQDDIKFRKIRDAFFKLNPSKFLEGSANQFGESMLKNAGAHYVKVDGVLYVLGDDAFKFASLFHQDCLRPMSKGVLNPKQPVSNLMVGELVKAIAGRPTSDDDVLYYCVPAEPIDADFDVEYHKQILGGVFDDLGYKNVNVMNEGMPVRY